ncbi:hypothetical protein GXW74_26835 [Roseomonas eburnea]|uniref:EF-hand domain-containing protein n=1 Tax=Neoroseomonas eburnea TaxID=1346889 RepID=A0A9X9XK73_9PROT|nr:hypothetical protein [Neoroseomonas eburnea]MBR0684109.1 hypothetical protein [Neoroseomonas eburnea]
MRHLLLAATLLAAAPAAAQGVPEPLRGTWAAGECAAPTALLHVTARSLARLPADGPARLMRFRRLREQGGWTFGIGGGAEAPRVLLRAAGDALETIEPDAKTRDDRLPDATPPVRWRRCAAPPPSLAVLNGEGLAFLAALERMEAACQTGTTEPCIAAVVAEGDVSGDGRLGVAEVARLLRGAAWAMAAQEGAEPEGLVVAAGLGGLAALAAARLVVEGLDYDGDGRLSAVELGQDRIAYPPGVGAAGGTPLALEALGEGAGLLRALLERAAEN